MLSLFKTRLPMHIKILLGIGAGTLVGLLAARLGHSGVV